MPNVTTVPAATLEVGDHLVLRYHHQLDGTVLSTVVTADTVLATLATPDGVACREYEHNEDLLVLRDVTTDATR